MGNQQSPLRQKKKIIKAKNIILLGYDGQKTNGKAHWHADHPRGMGNAGPVDKWVKQLSIVTGKQIGRAHV